MGKVTIRDIDVFEKKVLLRADFNVPMKDGVITDDNRIKEELPTINYLLEKGASLIICSHLGRPEGEFNSKYSLRPVAVRLSEFLNKPVIMSSDVIGKDATKLSKNLKPGEILMLENVRFHSEEEENDPKFAEKLAKLADVYVNDAFGTAHRKHASTYGVAKLLPNAMGFLIEKELNVFAKAFENPARPFVAIFGGAKVKDKLLLINNVIGKADTILIGGGMAYTFLKAMGYKVGKSKVEKEYLKEVKTMLTNAEENGVNIILPMDHVVCDNIENPTIIENTDGVNIPENLIGVDIGKKTAKTFYKIIKKAKLVLWNGPMGIFETPEFSSGTKKVAKALAKCKGVTIVGGGDSAAAVINMGYSKKVTHVSTGGGASLKLFEGKVLPAIDIIQNKN